MRQRSKLHWSNVVCHPWAIVVYNVEPTLGQCRNAIWGGGLAQFWNWKVNSQFKSVFIPQSGNTFPQFPGIQFHKIKHIYENGIFMLLDRIYVSKSSGPDKLLGRLLQSLAKEIP